MNAAPCEVKTPDRSDTGGASLLRPTLFGFLNGYFVLHPAAMVIFRILEGHQTQRGGLSLSESLWHPLVHSFQLAMLPMGLAFGFVGAALGLAYGSQNRTIRVQRDRLRRQLARNDGLVEELRLRADQLRQQNDRLTELELVKRRTTHFLVHDFKTQLNCIEGFANLAAENEEAGHRAADPDALRRIRRQARGMLASVNSLLDIARLEEAPELRTERVTPRRLLDTVAADMALPAWDCAIRVDGASRGCPDVNAEPALIQRVLLNLVSNATKHNGPGTSISLSAGVSPEREEVVFSCRDDGAGISADRLSTLFEPFRTGDRAPPESTGLGLAFARSAVEAHGGRIWCDSVPGHGSCFCFALPIDRSTRMTVQEQSQKRVLVVEDEPDFAALMESMLRGLGYEVDIAYDGAEALAQAEAALPDVITLDISMPNKSGAHFYRQLKSREGFCTIPVIVVTGLRREDPDWDGIIRSFLESEHVPHPDAYLDKPVEREALGQVIEDVLAATPAN